MKCASGCVRKTSAPVVAGCCASLPGTGSALKKIVHAAEQERADVVEARQRWREDQHSLDPARLVFIDETGTSTNMTRLRGRARAALVWSAACRTVIGRSPPSSPACAAA